MGGVYVKECDEKIWASLQGCIRINPAFHCAVIVAVLRCCLLCVHPTLGSVKASLIEELRRQGSAQMGTAAVTFRVLYMCWVCGGARSVNLDGFLG